MYASRRVFVLMVVCAAAAFVMTKGGSGGGRSPAWREYDREGRLARLAIDTNMDGRPDLVEYFDRGALVRREVDRNYDGRTDVIDEFDSESGEEIREVEDVDFDGVGDELLLFSDGRSVFCQRLEHAATQSPNISSGRAGELAPLTDPFSQDRTMRARPKRADAHGGLAPPKVVPPASDFRTIVSITAGTASVSRLHSSIRLLSHAPRAPPLSIHA